MNERVINNRIPDDRVNGDVTRACSMILAGEVQRAVIIYTTGTEFRMASLQQDRHVNIGLASTFMMMQQAAMSAEMQQQSDDEDESPA